MPMIVIKDRSSGGIVHKSDARDLKDAIIKAVVSGANLSRANLSGADLYRANLSGANLSRADLSRANLSRANLYGADLSGANLSRANLSGANLSRANLSGADLSGADGLDPRRVNPLLSLFVQPGKIRGYKLVTSFREGPYNGGIVYETGETYSVDEWDSDPFTDCGAGINLATLPWCMHEMKSNYRILLAEHTAKDIVAVPWFSDGKYRVKRCKIVGEVAP